MEKENKNSVSRRSFLKSSALVGAAGMLGTGSLGVFTSCSETDKGPVYTPLKAPGEYYFADLTMDKAKDGKALKAGIIGCGGRGTGAAIDWMESGPNVTIVALCDVFKERVDNCARELKERYNIDIPEDKRFVGFDAYKQVVDAGIDVAVVCTPPVFRPEHFKYLVEKNKHAFLEKPIFVDSAGYRTVVAAARQAQAKKLNIVTGTQRHHQRNYIAAYQKVMEGYIGEITGGTVYWNQNMLWYRSREAGWGDGEWMIKDWVNWNWLSGDHIVEQHVHNIDVFTWFSGLRPVKATGFGSRHRRVTGDQYDNFSIDFEMENGVHLHSMCRQIDGCVNNVSEFIQGTKGSVETSSDGKAIIKDLSGKVIWEYDFEAEKTQYKQTNPYTLEHVNLVNCIRANTPIEQASETAISNMAAVMGRQSAYTGQAVTWDEMVAAQLDLTPKDLNLGKMDMKGYVVPVPGTAQNK